MLAVAAQRALAYSLLELPLGLGFGEWVWCRV